MKVQVLDAEQLTRAGESRAYSIGGVGEYLACNLRHGLDYGEHRLKQATLGTVADPPYAGEREKREKWNCAIIALALNQRALRTAILPLELPCLLYFLPKTS